MAYTFLKAQGYEIGTSLVEDDKLDLAKELLEKAAGKLILPLDHKVANAFAGYTEVKETADQNIPEGFMGLDVASKTIADYSTQLEGAKTVVWNGPVGVFENPDFQAGTVGLMEAIVNQLSVVVIQLQLQSTLVMLINSHGSLLVVVLLWNFLKVKYCQVWLHLLKNNQIKNCLRSQI